MNDAENIWITLEFVYKQRVRVQYGYMQGIKSILITTCLVVLMSPILFAGEVYKWIDKDGVVHVTDDPVKRVSVFF